MAKKQHKSKSYSGKGQKSKEDGENEKQVEVKALKFQAEDSKNTTEAAESNLGKTVNKDQSKRVSERKYPHRMSRKGNVGVQEEEEAAGQMDPEEDPDRAILWKIGLMTDDEKVDEGLTEIYGKIKQKGEFVPSGMNDVLSTALQTPEHGGRGPRKVELAVERIENMVAFVDRVIQEDALVPVPIVGEIETVRQAVGSYLAWPRDLISFTPIISKFLIYNIWRRLWESTTTTMAKTRRTVRALEGGTPTGTTQVISSTVEVPPHSTYATTQGEAQIGATEPQP
ncbi:hypothetical protein AgCh_032803 [Apium graveolens]